MEALCQDAYYYPESRFGEDLSLLQHAHSVDFAAMISPGNFSKHVVHDDSGIDCMVLWKFFNLLQNAGCLNS